MASYVNHGVFTGIAYGGGNVTLGWTPTTGNHLIALWAVAGDHHLTSLTQTGVTWSGSAAVGGYIASDTASIWTGYVSGSASTTLAVGGTSTMGAGRLTVVEISGLNNSSLVNATASNSGSTSGSGGTASASVTPTGGGNGIVLSVACTHANSTSGPTGGYTALNASGNPGPSGYLIVTGFSGSYAGGWGVGNYNTWSAVSVALNDAASSVDVAGTITPAGTVSTSATNDTLAIGTITPAGAVSTAVESNDVAVAGTVTPTGELDPITVGFADGSFVGTITPAGVVAASQVAFTVDLDGTITPSGDLGDANQVAFTLAGTLTPAGTPGVPTAIEHALAGSVTPAGDVTSGLYEGVTLLLHSNTGSD